MTRYSLAQVVPHTKQPLSFILHKRIWFPKVGAISIGEILLILIWLGTNLAIFFVSQEKTKARTGDVYRHWIRPLGDIQAFNLGIVFILATRTSLFEVIFGLPFERANFYHRWIARFFVLSFFVHLSLAFKRFEKSIFSFEPDKWGFVGTTFFVFLFLFTWRPIRRRLWELFYYTHMVALLGTGFVLTHIFQLKVDFNGTPTWFGPAVLLFGVFLFLFDLCWRFVQWIFTTPISSATPLHEVTRIEFPKKFHYEAGQYVFVMFPSVSPFEWHPFSLSSAPSEETCTLHIKGSGGFTNKLRTVAEKGNLKNMRVEGPYGRVSMELSQYKVIILVCGGVGVTPMISILKDIYFSHLSKVTKVYFLWTARSPLAFEWFADSMEQMKDEKKIKIELFSSGKGNEENPSLPVTPSRPNFSKIFDEVGELHFEEKIAAVLACGPAPMVESLSQLAIKASSSRMTFHFHSETFAF